MDRELYLPRSWTNDPERLRAVGVPDQVGFATKPELATAMIGRALDAGMPAARVTGDEVYGANPALRAELQARGVGYVLAVARDHHVRFSGTSHRLDALLTKVPARAWQTISAGKGAKGQRLYDLAVLVGNEVAHLFAALLAQPTGDRDHRLRWSAWRRRHQARARTCHYRRQAAWDP